MRALYTDNNGPFCYCKSDPWNVSSILSDIYPLQRVESLQLAVDFFILMHSSYACITGVLTVIENTQI